MKRLSLLALIATMSLTACTTAEERAAAYQAQKERDHAECRSLGFEKNTEAYGNCRLKLREIRAQERTAAAARNSRFGVGYGHGGGFGRYHW